MSRYHARMGRLEQRFNECRQADRGALMPFVVAGDPYPGCLPATLDALQKAGADAVEIGIPFSDPIADGPVIAAAMHRSLTRGTTVQSTLDEVAAIRNTIEIPLLAMVSVSIVDRLEGPRFLDRLSTAGFDGIIVPDGDLDTITPLASRADELDMAFSSLIAPDTGLDRAALIAGQAREFLYVLARRGLTGARTEAPDLEPRARELATITALPLVAGFGISSPEHVEAVLRHAQGAIVGSALVARMAEARDEAALRTTIEETIRPMADRAATSSAGS